MSVTCARRNRQVTRSCEHGFQTVCFAAPLNDVPALPRRGDSHAAASATVDERSGTVVHELEFISDGVKGDRKCHRPILLPAAECV